jgi:general secretion pathway protein L
MSGTDGLVVILPEESGAEPLRIRVAGGAEVQSGTGANWLAACRLAA